MSEFRTVVSPSSTQSLIGLKHQIFTIGSCFSDTIGRQLALCKFHTQTNPFGVIYNPISIHLLLSDSISCSPPAPQSFLQNQEICLHYDFHSSIGALDRLTAERNINKKISAAHDFIKAADWIVITYGTAWVYVLRDTGRIVANCHKMPATLFDKKLLNAEEIAASFQEVHTAVKLINPKIKFLVTVSPVRHIKDSIQLNQVSKSVLRVACHSISTQFTDVEYFPSYEIMMDDLRDYRFYKEDMIHPTEQAEEYIWKKFIATYFDDNAKKFVIEWKGIQAALAHRPFYSESSGHQNFLRHTIRKLENLQSTVDVSAEIAVLRSQLKS